MSNLRGRVKTTSLCRYQKVPARSPTLMFSMKSSCYGTMPNVTTSNPKTQFESDTSELEPNAKPIEVLPIFSSSTVDVEGQQFSLAGLLQWQVRLVRQEGPVLAPKVRGENIGFPFQKKLVEMGLI